MMTTGSTTAPKTIELLREKFAAFGIPLELVSNKGPQFKAGEFEDFCRAKGIRHTLVAPYHLASNGAAERAVRILKDALLRDVLQKKQGGQRCP